jgi:hypothetical protein
MRHAAQTYAPRRTLAILSILGVNGAVIRGSTTPYCQAVMENLGAGASWRRKRDDAISLYKQHEEQEQTDCAEAPDEEA